MMDGWAVAADGTAQSGRVQLRCHCASQLAELPAHTRIHPIVSVQPAIVQRGVGMTAAQRDSRPHSDPLARPVQRVLWPAALGQVVQAQGQSGSIGTPDSNTKQHTAQKSPLTSLTGAATEKEENKK